MMRDRSWLSVPVSLPLLMRMSMGIALSASLAACVMPPPRHEEVVRIEPSHAYDDALRRTQQVEGRAADLHRRLDHHARQGDYPPRYADMLYGRLGGVEREVHDIAARHNGAISGEDQGRLNQQLDDLARMVR